MIKLVAVSGAPEARAADLLVYAVFVDGAARPAGRAAKTTAKKKGSDLSAPLQAVDLALAGVLGEAMAAEGFTGAVGQSLLLHTHGKLAAARVLLLGLGSKEKLGPDTMRRFAGQAVKHAEKCKAKKAVLVLPEAEEEVRLEVGVQAAAEGAILASYRFDKYLTENKPVSTLVTLELALPNRQKVDAALARAQAIAEGVCFARDLVNEPPASLTPVEFARRAQVAGKAAGLKVTVLDEKGILREKMGLMYGVAKASLPYTPPRVVRLEYRPRGKAKKHVALVGKGLTFDCGGLDIKPADGMLEMKIDMGGAAAVLGALA